MNLLAVWPWPYVSIPLSLSLLICMIEIIIHLLRLLRGWTGKCVQCWNSKELKNGAIIITSSYGCSWSCQLLLTLIPNEGSAKLRWGWQVVKTSTHSPTYCSRHCTSDRHIVSQSTHAADRERLPSQGISLHGMGVHSSCRVLAFQPLFAACLL